jgi:hypothetical protein
MANLFEEGISDDTDKIVHSFFQCFHRAVASVPAWDVIAVDWRTGCTLPNTLDLHATLGRFPS